MNGWRFSKQLSPSQEKFTRSINYFKLKFISSIYCNIIAQSVIDSLILMMQQLVICFKNDFILCTLTVNLHNRPKVIKSLKA